MYRKLVTLIFLFAVCGNVFVNAQASQAEEKSAAEIAKELANPATPLSSLTSNFEYRSFKGNLPGANSQESWLYSFQPSFPFPVGETIFGEDSIFALRPLIPVLYQPVLEEFGFEDKGPELGDIGFDAVVGGTDKETGLILIAGMVGTLPTGTGFAGGDQWRLGPSAIVGVAKPWGVLGLFPSHQWDLGGWNDEAFSTTGLQYIYAFNLENAWQITSSPTITYDWQADSNNDWTVPLGIGVAKTTKFGKTPWKFQLELQYYVDQPDNFGSEWFVKLQVKPVVPNPFI